MRCRSGLPFPALHKTGLAPQFRGGGLLEKMLELPDGASNIARLVLTPVNGPDLGRGDGRNGQFQAFYRISSLSSPASFQLRLTVQKGMTEIARKSRRQFCRHMTVGGCQPRVILIRETPHTEISHGPIPLPRRVLVGHAGAAPGSRSGPRAFVREKTGAGGCGIAPAMVLLVHVPCSSDEETVLRGFLGLGLRCRGFGSPHVHLVGPQLLPPFLHLHHFPSVDGVELTHLALRGQWALHNQGNIQLVQLVIQDIQILATVLDVVAPEHNAPQIGVLSQRVEVLKKLKLVGSQADDFQVREAARPHTGHAPELVVVQIDLQEPRDGAQGMESGFSAQLVVF
mmetsp:Transcript_79811/g.133311  ORF Transcript_79811/g.133311 Transcript_79811/m.133311 type:complete len:341 (-) Transcript_79811:1072-2094(-)